MAASGRDLIQPKSVQWLVAGAAFVVIIAGLRESRDIMVPFLLSCFIAIVAAPALFSLRRIGLSTVTALVLVILSIIGVGTLLGALIGSSVDDFSAQLPQYQDKLNAQLVQLRGWLGGFGIEVETRALTTLLDPGRAMQMAAQGLSSLGGLLTNTLLILLTVSFILLEASSFPAKLRAILPDPEQSFGQLGKMLQDIKRYMAIKTLTSMATGLVVMAWLLVLGVDYPVLWGVLAFFLNFVPNIGSIIAAVPVVLLASIQLGASGAFWVGMGYIVVNNVVGNIIEPRFMGRGLGMSTLVVFLSLVFWGWVLGTVGMFLSVPLTMTVKIALDSWEETRWIAVLLGPAIPTPTDDPPKPSLLDRLPRIGRGPKGEARD